jgi:hypothetical protein
MSHLMSQYTILTWSYNYRDTRGLRRGGTGHYKGVLLKCTFSGGWAKNPFLQAFPDPATVQHTDRSTFGAFFRTQRYTHPQRVDALYGVCSGCV